jgi:uncharacterized protein YihD (DUF1040 family)
LAWTTGGYYEFRGFKIGPLVWNRGKEIEAKYRTVQTYIMQTPNAYYSSNINEVIEEANPSFEKEIDILNKRLFAIVRSKGGNTKKALGTLSDDHVLVYTLMLIGFDIANDIKNLINKMVQKKRSGFETYLMTPWQQTAVERERAAIAEAEKQLVKDRSSHNTLVKKLAEEFGYLHQDYLGQAWTADDYSEAVKDKTFLQSHMNDKYDVSDLTDYERWLVSIFKKVLYMYEEGRNAMVRCVWAMIYSIENNLWLSEGRTTRNKICLIENI